MPPEPWPARPWPPAVPRFATKRNPERETLGPQVAETCRRLGMEPLPWQCDAWDVQFELRPGTTQLHYRHVVILTPRQSAKSIYVLVGQLFRALHGEELGWGAFQECAFTAQRGSNAAKTLKKWWRIVERSRIGQDDIRRFLRSAGNETYEFNNGSRLYAFVPDGIAAHGDTIDQTTVDEAFAFVDDRVESGARPAMITRKSSQLVVVSTAGTHESVYLRAKVDEGRALAESGDDSRTMYLEFSADPAVDDIHDPEQFYKWMPALGFLTTLEDIVFEHDSMTEDQWARAFCNLWVGSSEQVIPAVNWAAASSPEFEREGKVWLAVDVSPGIGGHGRSASIVAATYYCDEIHVKVLSHGAGTSWVADKVAEWTRATTVEGVFVDSVGPVASITADIRARSSANVIEFTFGDVVAAWGRFHQGILDKTIRHHSQDPLNAAIEGAALRFSNDGTALKRRTSTTDISPLVAATFASWAAILGGKESSITMWYPGMKDEAA